MFLDLCTFGTCDMGIILLCLFAESCVALYSYSSAEAGDLNFNEGDVIRVTRKQDDWWTGVLGDQIGIFPWSYVKRIVKVGFCLGHIHSIRTVHYVEDR